VTLSMHPRNPWRGTDCHDTHARNLDELFEKGTVANLLWIADLEHVASALQSLQKAGVVVLWRPFHEANGGWFWWGGSGGDSSVGPDEFRRLWTELFNYLTYQKNLNNLLWVYAPTANGDSTSDRIGKMYPGAELVDIVGLDWYVETPDDSIANAYQQLRRFDKPMGLCEFGLANERDDSFDSYHILEKIVSDFPGLCFVLYWHSWRGSPVALVDTAHFDKVVGADFAITLEEASRRSAHQLHSKWFPAPWLEVTNSYPFDVIIARWIHHDQCDVHSRRSDREKTYGLLAIAPHRSQQEC